MVKTVKKLLNSTPDMYMALLSYRATPLHLSDFAERDRQYKEKQKEDFDRCHRARTLPPLPNDSDVWVNTQRNQVSGQVVSPAATPR